VSGDPKSWDQEQYSEALQNPIAVAGFLSDMNALRDCDVCILVLPAGVSAALEFGWACGAQKKTIVYGMPREPDLMIKMSHYYAQSVAEMVGRLAFLEGEK